MTTGAIFDQIQTVYQQLAALQAQLQRQPSTQLNGTAETQEVQRLLERFNRELATCLDEGCTRSDRISAAGCEPPQSLRSHDVVGQSQTRFGQLADAIADIVLVYDLEGHIQFINRAGQDFSQISQTTHRPLVESDVFPVEVAACCMQLRQQAIATQQTQHRVYSTQLAPDRPFSFAATYLPLMGRDGPEILGIIRNMTQQRQLETALELAEEKFYKAFRSSPLMIAIATLQDGRMVEVNDSFLKTYGYSRQDLIGRTAIELNLWHSQSDRQHMIEQIKHQGRVQNLESYCQTQSGERIAVSFSAERIDIGGEPCILVTSVNITDQKQTEDAFTSSEERYRTLMETAGDAIIVANIETGRIVDANLKASQLLGLSLNQMIGAPHACLYPPEQVQHCFTMLFQPSDQGDQLGNEVNLLHADGHLIPAEVSSSIFEVKGKTYIQGIFRDISARKRAEDQIRTSLQEKEVLLKEIHHRVKNNLQIISSLLDLQANRVSDRHICEILRDNQNRISSMAMVHECLYGSSNFARIDFSKYVRTLVIQLFQTYDTPLQPADLQMSLQPQIFLTIEQAIPSGLLLNELITNALKHGLNGRSDGSLTVQLHRVNEQIVLTVGNDGDRLPADFDLTSVASLGMQLICTLTRQLQGTIRLERGAHTMFHISFVPLP